MNLSAHFTLAEMTHSQAASRLGIDNMPGDRELANLAHLCTDLEAIRAFLGHPIIISSGYRAPKVNAAVGGSPRSAHIRGLAADFICPEYGDSTAICERILNSQLLFDQLIDEGGWVHYAIPALGAGARRSVLTAHFGPSGTTYTQGLSGKP